MSREGADVLAQGLSRRRGVEALPHVETPISLGEFLDKMTILELKAHYFRREEQRCSVRAELEVLAKIERSLMLDTKILELRVELKTTNDALWRIEEEIRACVAVGEPTARFVALAKRVHEGNDRRAAIKREINRWVGSDFVEEKDYAASTSEPYSTSART